MTFFSNQEWVFQQDSVPAKTTQEWLRRNLLAFISAHNWLSGSADLKTLDNKLWAVLEDMACQKHHNSLEILRRSLVKAAAEIPWRRSVRLQQSGRSISRLVSRHRAAILSDVIVNENLNLLQINYLARNVWMFCLIFLLGHIVLITELWQDLLKTIDGVITVICY
jgi:hypothetical protein